MSSQALYTLVYRDGRSGFSSAQGEAWRASLIECNQQAARNCRTWRMEL
jgi:hypothetical protein